MHSRLNILEKKTGTCTTTLTIIASVRGAGYFIRRKSKRIEFGDYSLTHVSSLTALSFRFSLIGCRNSEPELAYIRRERSLGLN